MKRGMNSWRMQVAAYKLIIVAGLFAATLIVTRLEEINPQELEVDLNPVAVVIDDKVRHAFAISQGAIGNLGEPLEAGTVTMIDIATGTVVRTTQVGIAPISAAVDERNDRVFVVNQGAFDPSGRQSSSGSVSILDATTGDLLRTVQVGIGALQIAVANRVERVLVINREIASETGSVTILDNRSGETLGEIRVDSYPVDVAVSSQQNIAFVANFLSNSVSVLDFDKMQVIKTIPLSPGLIPEPGTLAKLVLDEQTQHLFALSLAPHVKGGATDGRLWIIDAGHGEIISTRVLSNPTAIALNAPMQQVLVTGTDGQTGWLTALDAENGNTLWTSRVGEDPNAISVDEAVGLVFVLSWKSGTLSVIQAGDGKNLCTQMVAEQPVAIAVSRLVHTVIIASHKDNSVSIWRSVC